MYRATNVTGGRHVPVRTTGPEVVWIKEADTSVYVLFGAEGGASYGT